MTDDERKHCEDVARSALGSIRGLAGFQRVEDMADVIARERAAARAEALEEADQAVRLNVQRSDAMRQAVDAIRAIKERP